MLRSLLSPCDLPGGATAARRAGESTGGNAEAGLRLVSRCARPDASRLAGSHRRVAARTESPGLFVDCAPFRTAHVRPTKRARPESSAPLESACVQSPPRAYAPSFLRSAHLRRACEPESAVRLGRQHRHVIRLVNQRARGNAAQAPCGARGLERCAAASERCGSDPTGDQRSGARASASSGPVAAVHSRASGGCACV
jgi:hypothetical protein